MRLLYLTAHLSDADLAQRALERLSPPVQVEACASVKDVLQQLGSTPAPDAVLVDTTPPTHEPLRALADIRGASPGMVLLALVRPGADAMTADALVAGADDTLVKQKEFFLHVPAAVTRVLARRPPAAGDGGPQRVLVVAPAGHPVVSAVGDFRVTIADENWWAAPADQTLAARPDVLVLTDTEGPTAVASATKALRDRTLTTPVVLVTGASPSPTEMYERLGIAAVLGEEAVARLGDVVARVAATSRLSAQVAVLRAKEQRLRGIIESVPASVVLIAADGTVLAMNVAGLAVAGARGAADIVGRSILTMCDAAAANDLLDFVTRVCRGAPGLARFPGRGLDGTPKTFEIRAVPMAREQDTTVLLGAMRVAVPSAAAPSAPRPASAGATEVELSLEAVSGSPDADAIRAELEALRGTLTQEQEAHAEARGRLTEADTREAVQEVAWSAIQAELQRKLILQASLPDQQEEHERARALLEQTVRERDQQLLSLTEALEATEGGLRQAGTEMARLRTEAEAREEDAASLRASVDTTAAREQHLLRVLAERDAELGGLRGELAGAQQTMADRAAEIQALKDAAEQQAREHGALVDVRQQVARLQAAAATAEQQQRALDEAHDQMMRLRAALEETLGANTDLERRLRDRDADLAAAFADRDRAQALVAEVEALEAAAIGRAQDQRAEQEAEMGRQLAEARTQLAEAETRLREADAARAAAGRAELDGARAEAARLLTRAFAAEDQAARLPDLHEQVEQWRSRHEGLQVELDALIGELAEARRQGDHAQHLAAELSAVRRGAADAQAAATAAGARADESAAVVEALERELAHARSLAERQREDSELRVAELTAGRDAAEARAAELIAAREGAEARIAEFAAAREAAETHVADLSAAHQAADARIADLVAARDEAEARGVHLEQLLAAARRELETAQADAAALQSARNDVQAELARKREALAALDAFGASAAAARDEALAALAGREQALAELRIATDAAAAEQAALRDAMAAAREAAETRVADLSAAHQAADARIADLLAARDEGEARGVHLEQRLAAARRELETAQADAAALQSARNDAQAALAREREALAALDAFGASAAAARDEALAALAGREQALGELRSATDAAAAEQAALRDAVATAARDRTRDTALLDELRARVASLQAALDSRQLALDHAAQEESRLRAAVAEAATARDSAEHAVTDARAAQRGVLDDQQSLRDQIAALQAQIAGQRQLVTEIDADRTALRERLARADAGSQLLASRQREAQEELECSVANLRARLADLEATAATERAALERALAARDASLGRLSQSGVVGMAVTTVDGALLRCNDALAVFCGYGSADEFLRRAATRGLPLVTNWASLARVVASAAGPVTVETSVQRPDGSVAWLQASAAANETTGAAPHLEWAVVDATDRYLRLRQQRQSRRLEAVRDLAVSAGGELLEALSPSPDEVAPGTATAAAARPGDARGRAREVAQQLVAFAQKQARQPRLVDLAEHIAHLRLSLTRLVGEDVSVSFDMPARALVVTADPAELDQWLTSLCVVLRDALPSMGALAVSAAARDLVLGASTATPRLAPVATLAMRASGFGVRAVTLPSAVADAVAQRGGVARHTHDAIAGTTTIEIHLPLVASLAGADAPFPLSAQLDADAAR